MNKLLSREPGLKIDATLRNWRIRAVNTTLIVVAVAAFAALAAELIEALLDPLTGQWSGVIAYGVFYLVVLLLAILRRLDYRVRGTVFVAMGLLAGVVSLLRSGLAGVGVVFLLVIPILAVLLVSVRLSVIATVISGAVFMVFAILADAGVLSSTLIYLDNPLNLSAWIPVGLVAFMFVVLVIVLQIQSLQELSTHISRRDRQNQLLDVVVQIGIALPREKEFDLLLEKLVIEAMNLYNADGGTLYLLEDGQLHFSIMRTESTDVALGGTTGKPIPYPPVSLYTSTGEPNHRNVASHTYHTGELINIPDVYEETSYDFSGTRSYDHRTGYRSVSFLSVPLRVSEGSIIGVLQLINARDSRSGQIIPFDSSTHSIINSLASLGTVAVQGYRREAALREQIKRLQIEIDESRREDEVKQITETDYFRDLQNRSQEMRKKRKGE